MKYISCKCKTCGKWFDRAIVHPYLIECPECRKGHPIIHFSKEERIFNNKVKCPECRKLLASIDHKRIGMMTCSKCKKLWWIFDGWFRDWINDDIFKDCKYIGNLKKQKFIEVIYR